MPQFRPLSRDSETVPVKMPLLYRIAHRIFLHYKPTKREQASAKAAQEIREMEAARKQEIRDALQTVIKHVRAEASATWACHCCQYRNTLIMIPGKHPLGIMVCEYCQHIYCADCTHLDMLLRRKTTGFDIIEKDDASPEEKDKEKELPYVSVCRACGLSWRAKEIGRSDAGMGKEGRYWGFGRKECICGCVPTKEKPWVGLKMMESKFVEGKARKLLRVLKGELESR